MGEDAQIDDPDEGYGLSPAYDETEISAEFDGNVERGGLVYSLDGSYAPRCYGKDVMRDMSVNRAASIRAAMSRESVVFRSGVFCDESAPILADISRASQFVVRQNGSTVHIPQPLDVPLKLKKSRLNRSRSSARLSSVKRREISPISAASPERNLSRNAQVYDPLCKISNETLGSTSSLDSNLVRKQKNVMDVIKGIVMTNCENQRSSSKPSSTIAPSTVVTRSGSSSTVSTGRDGLTSQVQHLRDAVAQMGFVDRAVAGYDCPTGSGCTDSPQDSFAMSNEPLVIQRDTNLSGGSFASTLEQARHNSPYALADAAIRDADQCSKALRSGALNYMMSKNTGTNTRRGETFCVKHHIITHRVEIPDHYKRYRRHSASLIPSMRRPEFRPFKLDGQSLFFDVDDMHHADDTPDICSGRNVAFGDIVSKAAVHDNVVCGAQHQRRKGGGKLGRHVVIGRAIHVRGRKYSRPASAHVMKSTVTQALPEKEGRTNITKDEGVPKTTEEHAVQTESDAVVVDVDIITKDEVEEADGLELKRRSSRESDKHVRFRKKSDAEKPPFMGSSHKSDSTFSIAGNKQQLMKVVSTSFKDWISIVTEIIFDSNCSDYARALQKALTRERKLHATELQSMEVDLKFCRNESVKNELRAEIARYKQRWTKRHEGVLNRLNNQIAKGGVWSQVQQLKTIYSAFVSS